MALQRISPFAYPDFRGSWLTGADAGIVIDAASEGVSLMCQAEQTDNITKVHFNVRVHTTGATIDVRIETIDDTTGLPSGSLLAAGSSGTVTTTGVGRYVCTLTTPVAVTRGDKFAVVVAQPAASFGNCQINCHTMTVGPSFPHSAQRIGGAGWARNSTVMLACMIEYETGGIVPQVHSTAYTDDTALTINTGTTPDERGNKFTLPVTVRVRGATMRTGTATGNLVFTLYDSADNVLATYTLDNNSVSTSNTLVTTILFSESITLTANEVYRLTYQSDSASNVIGFQTTFTTTDDHQGVVGDGVVQSTFRTNAGAWTDSELGLVWLGLLIDGISDISEGGGGGGGGGGRIIGVNC